MLVLGEVSPPEEGVRLVQDQVVAYANDDTIAGEGTLIVSESNVTWISRSDGRGFSLSYPSIVMHAVSTDCSSFPHEHVLVVVDAARAGRSHRRPREVLLYTEEEAAAANEVHLAHRELRDGGNENGGEDGDVDDQESDDGNLLLRFVPADVSALDTIYNEMAACQELNPDENDDMSEEEDDEEGGTMMEGMGQALDGLGPGWFTAANLNDAQLSEEGRANLERIMRNSNGMNGGGDVNGHGDDENMEDDE